MAAVRVVDQYVRGAGIAGSVDRGIGLRRHQLAKALVILALRGGLVSIDHADDAFHVHGDEHLECTGRFGCAGWRHEAQAENGPDESRVNLHIDRSRHFMYLQSSAYQLPRGRSAYTRRAAAIVESRGLRDTRSRAPAVAMSLRPISGPTVWRPPRTASANHPTAFHGRRCPLGCRRVPGV